MKLLDFLNSRKPKKPGIIKKPNLSSLDYHCSIVVEEEELGITAGFAELGREGSKLQQEIVETAQRGLSSSVSWAALRLIPTET
jgi:hypothetical protein